MFARTLLTLLPLVTLGCAPEPIHLAFQLQEGDSNVYSYAYSQNIRQTTDGKTTEVDQTLTLTWSEVIKEKGPDAVLSELTFESTKFRSSIIPPTGRTISEQFDSNDPESQPSITVRGYAGLVGRSIGFQQDARGELVEVTGCDELADSILQEFYDMKKPNEASAGSAFARQISTQAMADTLRPVKFGYPDEPVAIGDTWERHIEITAGFPHSQDSTYELKSVEGDRCVIGISSKITPIEGSPISHFGTTIVRTELSGRQSGEFIVQLATGRVEEGFFESKLEGSMTILGGDDGKDKRLPMKFTGRLDYERRD